MSKSPERKPLDILDYVSAERRNELMKILVPDAKKRFEMPEEEKNTLLREALLAEAQHEAEIEDTFNH